MLEMVQVDYIKYLRHKEGCSISEIARRVGISWVTAKKYADGCVDLQERPRQRRKRPVMGEYASLVDAWLEEDSRADRKQRRTAKRIYEMLVERVGFEGSERTVRAYVRERRRQIMAAREQYVRLEHQPGEAQVDFGWMKAIDPTVEKLVQYPYLNISFPYSNFGLPQVVPAENGECLFTILGNVFEELGGVPRIIVFDNLSAVVKKVEQGTDRRLTRMFKAFQWHYRFEARFCNTGRGNEKGNIENKVGYHRRNFMSPMPIIRGFGDLPRFNAYLRDMALQDADRVHYAKGQPIRQLWEEDKAALLTLPAQRFEAVKHETGTVNKYGEVRAADETYHVGAARPGQNVFIKVYWDHIEVLDEYGEQLIQDCPRRYAHRTEAIDWAAELRVFANKPRALEQATYLKALPQEVREYLLVEDLSERRRRVKTVIRLLADHGVRDIAKAARTALEYGKCDEAYLRVILGYNAAAGKAQAPLRECWTPESVLTWRPELTQYDELCGEVRDGEQVE